MQVQTNFTKRAEALLQGETGIFEFQYEAIPNVGDKLSIRTSPGQKTLTFVCIERHFNFIERSNHFIELVFDAS